jgi:hypothetical protein
MNGLPLITPGHLGVVPMREDLTLQYKFPCGTEAKSIGTLFIYTHCTRSLTSGSSPAAARFNLVGGC